MRCRYIRTEWCDEEVTKITSAYRDLERRGDKDALEAFIKDRRAHVVERYKVRRPVD